MKLSTELSTEAVGNFVAIDDAQTRVGWPPYTRLVTSFKQPIIRQLIDLPDIPTVQNMSRVGR